MPIDSTKKSSRFLQSRRYTHDTFTDAQESFTSVLDLNASEIYTDQALIPSSSLPYSASFQNGLTYSSGGNAVMKYWYRQNMTKSDLNNEVWFFLNPSGSTSGIGAQLIDANQQTSFISPKYSIPSLSNANAEDTPPGYLAKVFIDGTVQSTNNYAFDYKTGVLQFSSSAVAPSAGQVVSITAYQYVGRKLTNYVTDSGSFDTRINNASGNASAELGALSASFQAFSSSILLATASLNAFSASMLNFTASATANSSSFNSRIGALETFSSSLDATFATDADVNNLSSSFKAYTASLNLFSASINSYTASNNATVADLLVETASLQAATASLYSFSSSIYSYTASNNTVFGNTTASLNAFSASINNYTASNNANITSLNAFSASINSYTASNNSTISDIQSTTASLYNFTSSISATVADLLVETASLQAFSASMYSYTASNNTVFGNTTASLNLFTASINSYTASNNANISSINAQTASLLNYTASNNANISSLNAFSASSNLFTASINNYTASNNTVFGNTTASLYNFSSSILSTTASINLFTASINSYTASNSANISSFNNFSASILSYTASINAKTGSFATTGSNVFTADQTIQGTLTVNKIVVQTVTASQTYSSGSNVFGNSASNNQIFTGSVLVNGSISVSGSVINNLTASYAVSASQAISASQAFSSSYASNSDLLDGLDSTQFVQTGSFQNYTSSINDFSASVNSYTASNNANISSINAQTASLLNYTASNNASVVSIYNFSSSILSYTASNNANIASLNLATASLLNYTASNNASISSIYNFSSSILSYTASNNANISSINAQTASLLNYTASNNASITSIYNFSASILSYTASTNLTIADLLVETASLQAATASINAFSASVLSYTSSQNDRNGTYATTGSNTFKGNQVISGSLFTTGSNTLIGNTNLTGSLNVSGSQTFVGNMDLTGSFTVSGSTTQIGNNTLYGNTLLSGSITISGSTISPTYTSVKIYGNTDMTGYLRFYSQSVDIDTTVSASYIYVSGSTNDLYFAQSGKGYANTTRLRWLEGNLYSGLLNGGLITTQSSTVYQISSGSGILVSLNASFNDNPYPTIKYLNWPTLTASIAPLSASYDQSFVAIDDTSNIYAQGVPYSDGQFNTTIPIGVVIHQNRSTINGTQTFASLAYGWKQRSSDFIRAFGPLKLSGFTLAVSGSSTGSLVVASGTAWSDGRNYSVDPNNPSYIIDAGTSVSKIFRYRQSGSDWIYDTNGGAGYSTIDPSQYSNNGVLTAVSGSGSNKGWSIQRVYFFPNSVTKGIYVYYGNNQYATDSDAISNINVESFVEAPNTAAQAVYLGALILRNDANFTNGATYKIIPSGLFRSVGGSGGGGSIVTSTLAGLSDVSISGPQDHQPLAYDTTANKWTNQSAISASLRGNADTATSASYALSASFAVSSSQATSASYALSSSYALTSSYASVSNIQYITNSIQTLSGIEVADFDSNTAVTFTNGVLKFIFGTPAIPSSLNLTFNSTFATDRFNKVTDNYDVTASWSNGGYTLISASIYENSTLLTKVGSGTSVAYNTTTSGSHTYTLYVTASSPLDSSINIQTYSLSGTLSKSNPGNPSISSTPTVQLGYSSNQIEQGATGSISFTSSSGALNSWLLDYTTSNYTSPISVTGSLTGSSAISITATSYYHSPIGDNSPDLNTTTSTTTTYSKIRSLRYGASTPTSYTQAELENLANWDTSIGGTVGTVVKGTTNPSGQSVTIAWTGDKYHYIVYDASQSALSNITTSGFGVLGQFTVTTVGQYRIYRTTALQAGGAGSSITYVLT